MKLLSLLACWGLTAVALAAPDRTAQQIMDRFQNAKPTAAELGFFKLDWAADLAEAKRRAQAEDRPIFFIWVSNISASCDFFSGHC